MTDHDRMTDHDHAAHHDWVTAAAAAGGGTDCKELQEVTLGGTSENHYALGHRLAVLAACKGNSSAAPSSCCLVCAHIHACIHACSGFGSH